MDNSESNYISQKFIKKYSKEEFEFVVSLLPHSKLVEPIKKHPKKYKNDIKGFRPDHVSPKKLQDIYYTRIYKKIDESLAIHAEILIDNFLQKIDEKILQEIDTPEEVRNKIENNDMAYFDNLISLLIDTAYCKNIALYFKMIDYELTNDQKNYLSNNLEQKIIIKQIEHEIKNNLTETYENMIQDNEKKFKSLIADKENELKLVEREIKNTAQRFEAELLNKDQTIDCLKDDYNKKYKEFLLQEKNYTAEIDRLKELLDNLERENIEKGNKIKSLYELLEKKYDDFDVIANERWIRLNKKLLQEREEIQASISNLKVSKEEILKEIDSLYSSKCSLENKISSLENRSKDFMNDLRDVLNTIGFKQGDKVEIDKLFNVPSIIHDAEIEAIDNRSYFIDDLKTNLEISGINNEYAFDLAQYIYATFANKMSLLLVGYNTRKIADAVSYIVSGASAEVISLPLGYTDCNELVLSVSSSKSKVILIENTVDYISESVYLPLIKNNTNKFLLFSMESSENISLLPKCMLNYFMLIDLDLLLGYESNSDLLNGVVNQDIFDIPIDISSKSHNLRHIHGLDSVIELSNIAKLKIAEVMSIIDKLKSHNALFDILLFSINMLCKSNHRIDELNEFIKEQEFSPVTYKMLQSILGEDYDDD